MQSAIFVGMIILSLISALITGRMENLASAIMDGSKQAVELALFMVGVLCVWNGVLGVLEKSGGTKVFATILRPIIKFLFPKNSKNPVFTNAITMNMTSNLLGISNAATPMGLKATGEMSKNLKNGKADVETARLVVMNTASIQLMPTTICMLLGEKGIKNPYDILPSVWLASLLSLTVGLLSVSVLYMFDKNYN